MTEGKKARRVSKSIPPPFFLCICMGGIGKPFKPETGNFHLNLNSQRVFKNHQYFMVLKSNFGAFFQDKFSLCGITPNHLRFKLRNVSGNVLLFKNIKISLGLLITARKMHALFRENRSSKVSTTTNNLIRVSAVEPKIPSKS